MCFAQIPLCDVVEPPDFEELLSLYQNVIERDPLRQILEFPFDCIQLELVRRCVRTLAPVIPQRGSVIKSSCIDLCAQPRSLLFFVVDSVCLYVRLSVCHKHWFFFFSMELCHFLAVNSLWQKL